MHHRTLEKEVTVEPSGAMKTELFGTFLMIDNLLIDLYHLQSFFFGEKP